jgi:hypothetical protein
MLCKVPPFQSKTRFFSDAKRSSATVFAEHAHGRRMKEESATMNREDRTASSANVDVSAAKPATAEGLLSHGALEEGLEFLQKPCTRRALTWKIREILDSGSAKVAAAKRRSSPKTICCVRTELSREAQTGCCQFAFPRSWRA